MTITVDTIFYAVMILFVLIVTHAVAYMEGWQRGSREGLKKDLRAFISRDEINKAVDEIIKEREESTTHHINVMGLHLPCSTPKASTF